MASSEGPLYVPEGFDEAVTESGRPRPVYEDVLASLREADLGSIAERIGGHFDEHEIEFQSPNGSEDFHLDPVPRILTAEEWGELERGLRQRARALREFVIDAYSEQRIVREGAIPARVIETAERFEPEMVGVEADRLPPLVIGFDVVRGPDGAFQVLEDNATTPSGLAYALAARSTVDALVSLRPPAERRDPALLLDQLADVLAEATGESEPSAALLTDGEDNSAWFEHRDLAQRLDIPLLTPDRLSVRDGRLIAALDDGEERALDVIYRRTNEARLRDDDGDPTWLSELLLEPVRRGTLAVVSPLGVSVCDDKLTHVYVEEMVRFYLGEEPIVPSLRSYDLTIDAAREEVLDQIKRMVVKPRAESGGEGVVICAHASDADVERVAAEIVERPEDFIAQRTLQLSTHPTNCDGALEPRHVDLRAFAIGDEVMPGGITRVARERGSLVVNSSQDGGAKDTWVLAAAAPDPR